MLVLVTNKRTQVYVRNHDITLIGLVRERQRQGVLYWIKAKKSQLYIFFLPSYSLSFALKILRCNSLRCLLNVLLCLLIFLYFFSSLLLLQLCIISHYICLWKTNGIIQQLLTRTRKKLAEVLSRMGELG